MCTLCYAWRTHLGLTEIKIHICMSGQQKDLAYMLWQDVPKLVHAFLTCQPVTWTICILVIFSWGLFFKKSLNHPNFLRLFVLRYILIHVIKGSIREYNSM